MTVTALGSLTLGAALPGAALAASAGTAGIGLAIPDLQARIAQLGAALLALQAMPLIPDFAASLVLAQLTVSSMQLAIATPGLAPPSFSAAIAIVLAQIAALEAALALVQASLDTVASFQGHLSAGAIAVYAYDGSRGALGGELGGELAGGGAHANALVLYTEDPDSWTAMSAVLKVTP